MNIVKPHFGDIKTGLTNFFSGLGLIPSIVLVFIVGVVLYYAVGSATGYIHNAYTDHQVNAALAEAQAWKDKADQKEAEANQALGAAAAYKDQSIQVQTQLTELANARPELQRQTVTAGRKIEAIRNQPLRGVTDNMSVRVDELSKKLNSLYP